MGPRPVLLQSSRAFTHVHTTFMHTRHTRGMKHTADALAHTRTHMCVCTRTHSRCSASFARWRRRSPLVAERKPSDLLERSNSKGQCRPLSPLVPPFITGAARGLILCAQS